ESERIRGEMGALGKRGMLVEVDFVRRVSLKPITCTAGRARFFKPYCTARLTIVATLFQFSPYWRAVPCQLNSRASLATAFASDVVTRAQGSAQGKSSTRTPHRGHWTRRGR